MNPTNITWLLLLCDFLLCGLSAWPWPRARPSRWVSSGCLVPVIDACLLVTPQQLADDLRHPRCAGAGFLEQLGEDRPHLRHRHGRGFFPPTAAARFARTTTPTATASCGDASPPNCAPRSGPARPRLCPAGAPPRPGGGSHAPAPPGHAAPAARWTTRTTFLAQLRCNS